MSLVHHRDVSDDAPRSVAEDLPVISFRAEP